MSEGEFKKRIRLYIAANTPSGYLAGYGLHQVTDLDKMLDEARKDFLKDFIEDDLFVLKEYGLEDDVKLHPDAIKLKSEILMRWAKQSVPAFLKWLGEPEKSP